MKLGSGHLILDRERRIIIWIIGWSIGVVIDRCIGLQERVVTE